VGADAGENLDGDECAGGDQRPDQNAAGFTFVMMRVQKISPSLL
jgi:hypothetical protein